MFENMFSFIDPIIDPIIELSEDGNTSFVIELEAFYTFLQKTGLDKVTSSSEGTKLEIPLDAVMSLLRRDELEKLQKYIAFHLAKDGTDAQAS